MKWWKNLTPSTVYHRPRSDLKGIRIAAPLPILTQRPDQLIGVNDDCGNDQCYRECQHQHNPMPANPFHEHIHNRRF
jgi:hypothetical protein